MNVSKVSGKKCLQYGNDVPYENRRGKFCSQKCAAIYNNQRREKKKRFCLNCNKELIKGKNKWRGKFCDLNCHIEYKFKIFIERWKNGLEDGMSGKDSISRSIKKY